MTERATQEMEIFAGGFGSTVSDAPMAPPAQSSQDAAQNEDKD